MPLRMEGVRISPRASASCSNSQRRAAADLGSSRLAIVDLDLEMASGFELITTAHAAGTRVLIYSDRISPRLVDAARAAGADGLASKACRLGELVEALRTVGAGQCFVDPRFTWSDGADPPQRLT